MFTASSTSLKRHATFKIATKGNVRVTGIKWGTGSLLWAPEVDRDGYSYFLKPAANSVVPVDVRRSATLGMVPGAWLDFAGCL